MQYKVTLGISRVSVHTRNRRRGATLAALGLAMFLTVPATASLPPFPWTTILAATFRIFAMLPELPVSCTGWYALPYRKVSSSMLVSVYITAGHCPVPQVARTGDGLEQMAVLARVTRPGMDATVGLRPDPRPFRVFPSLALVPPRPGDRALVAGYSAGHLAESVLTVIDECSAGFLCFHSEQALRPGMSGAPILSLRTGEIVGILVASAQPRGYEDPHTVMATAASSLRALVEIAAPDAVRASSFPHPPLSRSLPFPSL